MASGSDDERKYVSPAKRWDVFISHASEDKPYIRRVYEELTNLGMSVFLDEQELVAGFSLRQQIENALQDSRFGVLFLSRAFFAKRWPREEFDALFTLEGGGSTRMMPIILDVSHEDVVSFSPILASRFAIHADPEPAKTATAILQHIEKIYSAEGSWANLVRIDTLCLPWVSRPRFLIKSLKMLDDFFSVFWSPVRTAKELPGGNDVKAVRVGDIIQAPDLCDGELVVLTGHQKLLQLYERHDGGFNEYVFQLVSNDPLHVRSIVYIRYVAHERYMTPPPNSPHIIDKIPTAPDGYLTNAIGVVIAHGAMRLADDSIHNCAYLVAADVMHIKKFSAS